MLIGGGTAGHSMPCIAVAEAVTDRAPQTECLFVGSTRALDRSLFERLDLPHALLDVHPFPYRISTALVRALVSSWRAREQVRELLAKISPSVLFSTGGYVSVPVLPEAARKRLAVVLHASDAVPGRANRALARFASLVTVAYEQASSYFSRSRVVVTGQPVRRSIVTASRDRGRRRMDIAPDAIVLLALGGSQGADSINRALVDALPHLLSIEHLHIVHFTGASHFQRVEAASAAYSACDKRYQCLPYLDDPGDVYAAADLVVSRCGANALAEIACLGLPCIAVPYPYAGGHQRLNLQPFLEAGAAVLLEDRHLSGGTLAGVVSELLADPQRLHQMAEAARSLAQPKAAEDVAALLMSYFPPREQC